MEYRAVGNRCATILDDLELPISNEKALEILIHKGFSILSVDVIELARQCINTSRYYRGAKPTEAPAVVDCSSFTKWLYAQQGIWLPRRSVQQSELGEMTNITNLAAGDLVFVSGWINYYRNDPAKGIGHVGIATANQTIIHAANRKLNVVETPVDEFISKTKFCEARRYITTDKKVLILETQLKRQVEVMDDIRWIILQSLPKK